MYVDNCYLSITPYLSLLILQQTFDESAEDSPVSFNLGETDTDNLDDCFSQ